MLAGFVAGDRESGDGFARAMHGRLVGLARRIAPDLAERDLEEDVVQRGYELLFGAGAGMYAPGWDGMMGCLAWTLRTAARDVRAEHAPPGERTRLYRKPTKRERRAYGRRLLGAYRRDALAAPWELVADPWDGTEAAECRLAAGEILALARATGPVTLVRALAMVARDEALLGEAAREVGMSRYALYRQIASWVEGQLMALAPYREGLRGAARARRALDRERRRRREAEREMERWMPGDEGGD